MNRCSVGVHNLKLQKGREKVWGGKDKISAGRFGSIPRHTSGLVGSLAKGIGMGPYINEEASFDYALQDWNVPNVGVDITGARIASNNCALAHTATRIAWACCARCP